MQALPMTREGPRWGSSDLTSWVYLLTVFGQ